MTGSHNPKTLAPPPSSRNPCSRRDGGRRQAKNAVPPLVAHFWSLFGRRPSWFCIVFPATNVLQRAGISPLLCWMVAWMAVVYPLIARAATPGGCGAAHPLLPAQGHRR